MFQTTNLYIYIYMGLSENSVPLQPMVLLIIIPTFYGYFIGGIPYFQTYPYIYIYIYTVYYMIYIHSI